MEGLVYRDWDDMAELPIPHFNFIIQLLLPRHLISTPQEKEQTVIENVNKQQHITFGERPSIKCVAVGSSAENYKIPSLIQKRSEVQAFLYSDMDILLEWQLPPLKESFENGNEKGRMIFEFQETSPGYARIHINDNDKMLDTRDTDFFVKLDNTFYLSAKKQREERFKDLEAEVLLDHVTYGIDMKGPAVAVEESTKLTPEFISSLEKLQIRQELVTAIPCIWPSNADKWRDRMLKNKMLPGFLVDDIISKGCHLVPVAHKHSTHPDIEWRISFATAEVAIASNWITTEQRQCYVYLKLLRQITMKEKCLITSYHCKTVFLYSCERLSPEAWDDNPGLCVLYMLDMLIQYVKEKYLPGFFIPETNLFDRFTDDEFEMCETISMAARMDPVGTILKFTDTHVIANQSVSESFRELISEVVADMKQFQIHKNVQTSIDTFITAFLKVIYANLIENKVSMAVAYSLDLSRFFSKFFPDNDIKYYLFCVFANIELSIQMVQIYERILSCAEEYPEVLGLRGHLAVLYHCASFNVSQESSTHKDCIKRAHSLFKAYFEESDCSYSTSVVINYANYLYSIKDFNQLQEILQVFLASDSEPKSMVNKFGSLTHSTLEPNLRNEMQQLFDKSILVSIPSKSLAYYMYIQCLRNHGTDIDIEQALVDFECCCKILADTWSYFLLALLLMCLERFQKAETIFSMTPKSPSFMKLNIATKIHICCVQQLFHEVKVKEAMQYMIHVAKTTYKHLHVSSYLSYLALNMSNISCTLKVFENMSNMADEHPEMMSTSGNAACVYHAYSQEFEIDSDEYLTAIAQAETLFNVYIGNENSRLSTKVEYAMFLISQCRFQEILDLLGDIYQLDMTCEDTNSYNWLERKRLDEQLQKEVSVHSQFGVKAVALAMYLHIKSSLKLETPVDDVNKGIELFKKFCDNEKHARSYSLLGYVYLLCDRYSEAQLSFCKAVVYCRTYSLAKQNIQYCRFKTKESGQKELDMRNLGFSFCLIPELYGDFEFDLDKMFRK